MPTNIQGQLVDLFSKKIYGVEITIDEGRIRDITKTKSRKGPYLLPGFVDAHIHIESSMLVPSEFARMALPYGTLSTVSDPHEIANVLGVGGVHYMIENAESLPIEILFGAPSCVPASVFETAGASLDSQTVSTLLEDPRIGYLSEVMNYPGVINRDRELMAMIAAARKNKKPVDGHAPGLRGEKLGAYVSAGIQTDHESFGYDEAKEKLSLGMKIIIREGSAAKNYSALAPLIREFPGQLMFCSDDKHPDDLLKGHINQVVARAVWDGYDLFDVLRIACINPRLHYPLRTGMLRLNDPADFIVAEDLTDFQINEVYFKGEKVVENGAVLFAPPAIPVVNQFKATYIKSDDLRLPALSEQISVIEAIDGQLITNHLHQPAMIREGYAVSNPKYDVLKIAVVNRYQPSKPAVGFIRGIGIKAGAFASCVAHDSHNIVAVGIDDDAIVRVVNKIIDQKGGIAAALNTFVLGLDLPVAGIMSNLDGKTVAKNYSLIDLFVRTDLKSPLRAPFMTLSFMALPVIPSLKMTDKGLFDGERFEWTTVFQ